MDSKNDTKYSVVDRLRFGSPERRSLKTATTNRIVPARHGSTDCLSGYTRPMSISSRPSRLRSCLHRSSLETSEAIEHHGGKLENFERQLAILRGASTSHSPARPCAIGDGIKRLESRGEGVRIRVAHRRRIAAAEKFVPASGAASRMFAFLPATRGSGTAELAAHAEPRRSRRATARGGRWIFSTDSISCPVSPELEELARQHTDAGLESAARHRTRVFS